MINFQRLRNDNNFALKLIAYFYRSARRVTNASHVIQRFDLCIYPKTILYSLGYCKRKGPGAAFLYNGRTASVSDIKEKFCSWKIKRISMKNKRWFGTYAHRHLILEHVMAVFLRKLSHVSWLSSFILLARHMIL